MATRSAVLRDMGARHGVKANEVARRAYLYVARNQALPTAIRHQAQLQLNTFGRYTRPTTVKNRCAETGRGRGVIREFAMCRVRLLYLSWRRFRVTHEYMQFQFRQKALAGELNGVRKAMW